VGERACVCVAGLVLLGRCPWMSGARSVTRVRANASGAGPSDGACSIGTSAPADASTLVPPAHASERARWPLRARARVSCFLIGCRGVVSAADWLVGWPRARARCPSLTKYCDLQCRRVACVGGLPPPRKFPPTRL